ncbi:MAG: hypothetical protein AB7F31_03885 [Parachlamydiales bacterium]
MSANPIDQKILGWGWTTRLEGICSQEEWGKADAERRVHWLGLSRLKDYPHRPQIQAAFKENIREPIIQIGKRQFALWLEVKLNVDKEPHASKVGLYLLEVPSAEMDTKHFKPLQPVRLVWPSLAEVQSGEATVQDILNKKLPLMGGNHPELFLYAVIRHWLTDHPYQEERPSFESEKALGHLSRMKELLDQYPASQMEEGQKYCQQAKKDILERNNQELGISDPEALRQKPLPPTPDPSKRKFKRKKVTPPKGKGEQESPKTQSSYLKWLVLAAAIGVGGIALWKVGPRVLQRFQR